MISENSTPSKLPFKPVSISVKTPPVFFVSILLLIGILWGATIPLAKVAVSSGYAPLGITFWEQVIIAIVSGIVLVVRSAILLRRMHLPLDSDALIYYGMIAALGVILPNLFSYWAASQLPAGIMAIVIASVPMFTLIIAITASIEPLVPYRVLGICLGCAAIILLVAPDASLPDPEKAIFVFVGLIAPFCYGLEANYIARFTPTQVDAIETLFCISVISLFVTGPLAGISGSWITISGAFTSAGKAILGLSVIHAAAYPTYIWLVGKAGPVFSSQVAYIITISAMFLSVIFLHEGYSPYAFTSLALMIAGLMLVQPPRTLKRKKGDRPLF